MNLIAAETGWLEQTGGETGVVQFPRKALRTAREILSFLPDDIDVLEHDNGTEIWYALRADSDRVRLKRIVMNSHSLAKLDEEPHRDVKIAYLRRELARALPSRSTWAYPRLRV